MGKPRNIFWDLKRSFRLYALRFWLLTFFTASPFRIIIRFIEVFMRLLIVSKNVAELFGGIHSLVVIITKGDDGCIFFHHANENGAVTMPPSVVVDQFFAPGKNNHSPAKTIIAFARLFQTVGRVRTVEGGLFKQDSTTQGSVPFEHVFRRAVNIFVPVNHVQVFHWI